EVPFARAEREVFDVEAKIDRQPLSVRPGIVRTVDDRGIGIAMMVGKLHADIPAGPGSTRPATVRGVRDLPLRRPGDLCAFQVALEHADMDQGLVRRTARTHL